MILTVDIGNTNISVAGFTCSDEPDFVKSYPDNLFHRKEEFVEELGKLSSSFSGAVLCSVVPALTRVVKNALEELCPCVKVVDSNFNDGLRISGYDRHKLGNDRVADMTAVKTLYPLPAVIFDMGTATTASVVDREGVFVGGMILPGMALSINALSSGTALLPVIKAQPPRSLLGQDTVSCINNGVVFSQAASLEGIISRVEEELGERVTAVVTGGSAGIILPFCRRKVIYDKNLLHKGLKILYEK